MDQVPNCENDNCGIIRLCVRYSELEKSIEYCKRLKEKGYAVSIQPMVTVRYTEEQLKYILDSANEMNAFAVYIVDSYGYLTQEGVLRYFNFYNENLKEEIKIGFHGHNNMYSAFSNAKSLIEMMKKGKFEEWFVKNQEYLDQMPPSEVWSTLDEKRNKHIELWKSGAVKYTLSRRSLIVPDLLKAGVNCRFVNCNQDDILKSSENPPVFEVVQQKISL